MPETTAYRVAAVSVNHNTSAYMELMLRSLCAYHRLDDCLQVTIFDNGSTDDTSALRAFAASVGVPVLDSGFPLATAHNSHGDVLRNFVLSTPDCSHYLFLDADVCFVEADTIGTMLDDLTRDASLFGIAPQPSWDGVSEIPAEIREANPDICDARLHPCCALVANKPLFRTVVEQIGLGCAKYLWAEREEYLDTFKLMTKVMNTHDLHHGFASTMVRHFSCVSYEWDSPETRQFKQATRDRLLADFRQQAAEQSAAQIA